MYLTLLIPVSLSKQTTFHVEISLKSDLAPKHFFLCARRPHPTYRVVVEPGPVSNKEHEWS